MTAFNEAMALESIPEGLDANSDLLIKYARTIAYKVFHNLQNGHKMDKDKDPITVDDQPASKAWADHYE